jgi:CBS domain-containing protein
MHHSPYLVSDVMTRAVVAVRREALSTEIGETMERWQVSAVPVLEAEDVVVGMVSEADLLPREELRDSDPHRKGWMRSFGESATVGASTAEQLMSSPVVTVHPDETLAQAARTMARERVKLLPVVDGEGRLRGVVSRSDLLKVFLRSDDDLAEEVRREVVARLFPVTCGDVRVRVVNGVVTLSGRVDDTLLVPVAARLVRAVEGVVDVEWALEAVTTA